MNLCNLCKKNRQKRMVNIAWIAPKTQPESTNSPWPI